MEMCQAAGFIHDMTTGVVPVEVGDIQRNVAVLKLPSSIKAVAAESPVPVHVLALVGLVTVD